MIPFGPFEPDRTIYAPDAITNVINALPVADGWSPMPNVSVVSSTLGTECLGAVYIRTTTGAYRIIAGTKTKLQELNSSTYGYTDLSKSGGYSVPDGDRWSFLPFGKNLLAANIADAIQYMDMDVGTEFDDLPGSPPKCKYLAVAGEYLVMAHIASFPNRVQTSGIGDASWHTVGQRGADYQDFPDGEEIMGVIGAERGAVIIQRTRLRQMSITTAGDYSFTTTILNPSRGVIAPHSIAQIGPGKFVYYSADGFFMNVEGIPIGDEKVDRWFDSQINRLYVPLIQSMVDPFAKIVWFKGRRIDGSYFLLGYRWSNNRWCYSDLNIEAMAALVTTAISIDGMDTLYATIDDVSEPFDSRLFSGGAPTMAAFDSSHRLCYLTGDNLPATLQTPDIPLSGNRRSFLQEVRAVGNVADFTLKAVTADFHGGPKTVGAPVSPYPQTGICHFRSSGFTHSLLMEIPSGAEWSHIVGLEPKFVAEGGR